MTASHARLQTRHQQALAELDAAQQALTCELLRPGRDPLALRATVDAVRAAELRVVTIADQVRRLGRRARQGDKR